jgi:hypothetical protein
MSVKDILLEKEELLKSSKKYIPFQDGWKNIFPHHAGVYVLWNGDIPVYVGETSGLFSRMHDLMNPVNHAFTKKISQETKITNLEVLRADISKKYTVSYIEVNFGRSEIEEFLILRWRNTLTNKPTKRLLKGSQYSWVRQGY